MKILVFSDFHGDIDGLYTAVGISKREKPDKTVICGDLFSSWSNNAPQVAELVQQLEGVLYLIRGNNDWRHNESFLPYGMEEYAVMYHFGRTLFFTHGDRYNGYRIPPMLKEGDVLIHGHTHVGRIYNCNGLHVLNVGSISRARDGVPNYMTIDEQGVILKQIDGSVLQQLHWK